jgi:AraC-like DNA-binding protein
VIFREMPPIWEPAFRARFYARWGRENAIISARTHRATYPEYEQLLSIKAVLGGSEDYYVAGRHLTVDDDTFLILNAGRRYASRIEAFRPVHSFSIFFRPQMAEAVLDALGRTLESALDEPQSRVSATIEFDERLRTHDGSVSPVLHHIRAVVDAGDADDAWVEEQLTFLLARIFRHERRLRRDAERIPAERPATRRELFRRVGLGTDFIHARFRDPIGLAEMAAAAHLSPYHFLRTFQAVHGVTPSAYLKRKRAAAAARLVRESGWTMAEIAEHVGFGSRTTLFRHLRDVPATANGRARPDR